MTGALSHRRAVALMLVVTLLWSVAGVVSRQLESARAFEITFWRSLFNALALAAMLAAWRGPRAWVASLAAGGRVMLISAVCWSVMYTAFMVALSLTTVANVLVTMAIAPLFTALAARLALGHRLAPRTWVAIVVAGCGIAWMYGAEVAGDAQALLGTAVALAVPVAAAVNWTLIQRHAGASAADLPNAVWLGAVISAAVTLPLAWPFAASGADIAWLAGLGVFQLAVPCLMVVAVAQVLKAPEVALLGLLEVVFGVLWAWLGAGESPSWPVLGGGALVLAALAANEALALRESGRDRGSALSRATAPGP